MQSNQIPQLSVKQSRPRVSIPKEYFKKHRVYEQKVSTIHEYAYYDEINIIHRDDMEDGYFFKEDFFDDGCKSIFFGIFDGHNGKQVMLFLLQNFPQEFILALKECNNDILKALEFTFEKINLMLEKELVNKKNIGSTGFVGLIREEGDKKEFYYANCGDTFGYLFNRYQDKVEQIGCEHRLGNKEEYNRIKQAGGEPLYNRVGGLLEMTRAFGDFHLKNQGIVATPYVNKIEITKEYSYMVIGSDGLIDYVSQKEMKTAIAKSKNCEDLADRLLNQSITNKSNDNISILVVRFDP